MASYVQQLRLAQVTTPLGKDVLLLQGFTGEEAISRLFRFEIEALAENTANVEFDKLLGQKVSIHLELPDAVEFRHFSGICVRASRGNRGEIFTHYKLEIVPKLWLLTQKYQSRIFQMKTIPDILMKVIGDANIEASWELNNRYEPRLYCVQYRETDFDFVCRLMEEEGIYYYFKHTEDGHEMVVADRPQSHRDMPYQSNLIYEQIEGEYREEDRVLAFHKGQNLLPGKFTVWDHKFQIPHKNLEAQRQVIDSAQLGTVKHKIKVGNNDSLEVYDYPGSYAKRYDELVNQLAGIYRDNLTRVQWMCESQGVTPALIVHGASSCRHIVPGFKFTLQRHFQDDGTYILTGVQHVCKQNLVYRSSQTGGSGTEFTYQNYFTCIPSGVPFRPPQITPKPVVRGSQTAVVTGPGGEEIYTDKYGRIKVQFFWDRDGKFNEDSSCWVRVATNWAGKNWGMITIPRIGQEVLVDFMEGDPDRPLVVGGVYNPDQMPPYELPDHKTVATWQSRSSKGGGGLNELRMEDLKGKEQIYIHAEKNMDRRVKEEDRTIIGKSQHLIVTENQKTLIKGNQHEHVNGNQVIKVDGNRHTQVSGNTEQKSGQKLAHEAGTEIHLKAGMKVIIEAGVQVTLKGPGGFIDIGPAGVTIQGTMVLINSGGSAGSGSGSSPSSPEDPDTADDGTKFDKL